MKERPHRLADGGKILIEIRGHLAQVVPFFRLLRKPEADAIGINVLECLFDSRLGDLDLLLALVEIFLAHAAAGH